MCDRFEECRCFARTVVMLASGESEMDRVSGFAPRNFELNDHSTVVNMRPSDQFSL